LVQLHHLAVHLAHQLQVAQQVAAPACLVAALALPQRLDSRPKVVLAAPQRLVMPLRHQPHLQLLHLASPQRLARRQLRLRHRLARAQALGKLLLLLLGSRVALGRQLHLGRLRHRRQPSVVLQRPRQRLLLGSQQQRQRLGSPVGLGVPQQVVQFLVVVVVLVGLVRLVAVPQTLSGLLPPPAAHQHSVVAGVDLVEQHLAHHSRHSSSSSREVAVCGQCVVDHHVSWAGCSVQQSGHGLCKCSAKYAQAVR
jgi:hypothetical protein